MCVYRLGAYSRTKAGLPTPTIRIFTRLFPISRYSTMQEIGCYVYILSTHIRHARKYKIPGNSRESFEEIVTVLYSLTQAEGNRVAEI